MSGRITAEMVKELFTYNSDGTLSSKASGNKVGYHWKDGYWGVKIKRRAYLLHRIIFAWHHGYFPEMVDHRNRDQTDNHIENLRDASNSINMHNSKLRADNKLGLRNICVHRPGVYKVQVSLDKITHTKYCKTLEEAIGERDNKRKELGLEAL